MARTAYAIGTGAAFIPLHEPENDLAQSALSLTDIVMPGALGMAKVSFTDAPVTFSA